MPRPTEIVQDFIALWEKPDGFPEAVGTYFRDDTVYENHGLKTTVGKDEALGFYREFSAATGMAAMKIDTHAIAETDGKVLTHRTDYLLGTDGKPVMEVPVMGIFEIEAGKIAAWRDYFDTKAHTPPAEGGE